MELYSKVDLTSDRKAVLLESCGQCLRFLFKNHRVEMAFLVILFMWEFHFMSSESVTPKYGLSGTCCSM